MARIGHELNEVAHALRAARRRLLDALAPLDLPPDIKETIMAAIDDLTTAVGNLETASAAAVAEIATLTSSENEAALEALVTRINAVTANLTEAVPAPAAPATPAEPAGS